MREITEDSTQGRDASVRRGTPHGPLIFIVALALALGVACGSGEAGKEQPEPSGAAALEEEYGIRITLVAVTAGGGLVDLRYQVTDAAKAAQVLGPGAEAPTLIAEESGKTLPSQQAPEETRPETGQTYFILYPNVENSVKPGSAVTVVIGDVRLEHLIAK
ncbi:MAG: hypothetical protein QME71_10395 [Dehalococcoidia bacterium]|nr:hypothetical protein [Dehalococcoidia bacterium]